tara:strand:+ start:6169 stop:6987 length:819 start_codon:yes stop_codon:yes gene_type:complete
MKHNKKRNTAFVYEVLSRELTKAIVNKNALRKNKIVTIIKEHFGAGTILAQELELYKVLMETNNAHIKIAERLLAETKVAHFRLKERAIFDAQSRLIGAINKQLSKEVWGNFVPNFKSLASINCIFNSKTGVKKKVLFEQALIDQMSKKNNSAQRSTLKAIDNLTYNSFIKKFNDKYGGLLQEQKDFLNRYITSFADEGFELRLYLNEELSRLKGLLGEASEAQLEPLVSQKVVEVLEYLEGFRKREFTETDLNKVLKTQQLVQELAANDHN